MSLSEFFERSAATRCFSVRAVQLTRCFSCFSCGQGRAAPLLLFVRAVPLFLPFRGNRPLAVPGGWTSPPLCELRTILQTDIFRHRVFRVIGLCTLGPHSFSPHSVRQTFQQFLQRCSYLCFLCYANNSPLCFRPFPETTFLERPRCRGAVLS